MRSAFVMLLSALAGCATPAAEATPTPSLTSIAATPSEVATSEAPNVRGDELTGLLGADSIEGGCAYLQTDDGTRYEVIYPQGYEIDRSSATLRDPSGEVIATAGDVVTVRGHEATEMVSICQIGPIFQATEVISVE